MEDPHIPYEKVLAALDVLDLNDDEPGSEDEEAGEKVDDTFDDRLRVFDPAPQPSQPSAPTPPPVYTRVLKDAWHLMDLIKAPKSHSSHTPFMGAFSSAVFVPNIDDLKRVHAIVTEKVGVFVVRAHTWHLNHSVVHY